MCHAAFVSFFLQTTEQVSGRADKEFVQGVHLELTEPRRLTKTV